MPRRLFAQRTATTCCRPSISSSGRTRTSSSNGSLAGGCGNRRKLNARPKAHRDRPRSGTRIGARGASTKIRAPDSTKRRSAEKSASSARIATRVPRASEAPNVRGTSIRARRSRGARNFRGSRRGQTARERNAALAVASANRGRRNRGPKPSDAHGRTNHAATPTATHRRTSRAPTPSGGHGRTSHGPIQTAAPGRTSHAPIRTAGHGRTSRETVSGNRGSAMPAATIAVTRSPGGPNPQATARVSPGDPSILSDNPRQPWRDRPNDPKRQTAPRQENEPKKRDETPDHPPAPERIVTKPKPPERG